MATSTNTTCRDGDTKLRCGGRPCAKCGGCRDWYMRLSDRRTTIYVKLVDAHCWITPGSPGAVVSGAVGRAYHTYPPLPSPLHRDYLCECADNWRSF
ncbi:unnamed protein product [Adineta steineri]|uniref:Uncharacterized protein n=1 Tax=Adineta steineri TaxID=433720 RepID=A0A815SR42_9BILA|nr:unnamed protein product [Adineta steineri]CAF1642666.1 unnamed protein product [Adineta steineri]